MHKIYLEWFKNAAVWIMNPELNSKHEMKQNKNE